MQTFYATIDDLKEYIGSTQLESLNIPSSTLENMILKAESIINSHLSNTYQMPLSRTPLLTHIALVISSQMVWNYAKTERIPNKYEIAYHQGMNLLISLANRSISLSEATHHKLPLIPQVIISCVEALDE